ncbi:MAG: TIGR03619 family F420-dependent LLM class oxidoreductase [Actinomycetota bacterium]
MEIGVSLPTVGPVAFREFILDAARRADAAGLHSVWTADHVVLPGDRGRSTYPFPQSEHGLSFAYEPGIDWMDPVAVMAFVSGATERIKVGSSILVLPYRNPLVLANEMATIDRLSEGRALLGIGSGWIVEEFEALGVDPKTRGRMTDEYIRVMRHLWTNDAPTSFEGEFVRFADVQLATRAFTSGGPPILIGGNSPAAIRRTATLADGWLAFDLTPEQVREGAARIREQAAAAGRDGDAILISARAGLMPEGAADFTPDRPAIRGDRAAMLEQLHAYAEAGVDFISIDLATTMDEIVPTVEWLGAEVTPAVA